MRLTCGEDTFQGLPVIAFEELEASFPPGQTSLFVAIGNQKVNQQRAGKVAEAEGRGYELASYLSSKSHVADDFVLKPNSFVMEEVFLLPQVSVGRDSILWRTMHHRFSNSHRRPLLAGRPYPGSRRHCRRL